MVNTFSFDRIAVTGAGGFIGSHLTEALLDRGAHVKALIHYNSLGQKGWLSKQLDEKKSLEIVAGDICDPFQMREFVEGTDIVFHLAALIGIPYSYHAPQSYVKNNIEGTLNLLQAAKAVGVKRFVHTSTSEVYGTAQYIPIDEKHPLQGQSPYSASKIGADKMVESYLRSFDLPAVTVRPFNTYGPRQSARAVIPTIISQALKSKTILLGSLSPMRDLTFVSDTVKGFIALASSNKAIGETVNLGVGKTVSIESLARMIFELFGGEFTIDCDEKRVRPNKSEVMELVSNNSKALKLSGWQPKVALKEGLQRTIEWMENHQHVFNVEQYTV